MIDSDRSRKQRLALCTDLIAFVLLPLRSSLSPYDWPLRLTKYRFKVPASSSIGWLFCTTRAEFYSSGGCRYRNKRRPDAAQVLELVRHFGRAYLTNWHLIISFPSTQTHNRIWQCRGPVLTSSQDAPFFHYHITAAAGGAALRARRSILKKGISGPRIWPHRWTRSFGVDGTGVLHPVASAETQDKGSEWRGGYGWVVRLQGLFRLYKEERWWRRIRCMRRV